MVGRIGSVGLICDLWIRFVILAVGLLVVLCWWWLGCVGVGFCVCVCFFFQLLGFVVVTGGPTVEVVVAVVLVFMVVVGCCGCL